MEINRKFLEYLCAYVLRAFEARSTFSMPSNVLSTENKNPDNESNAKKGLLMIDVIARVLQIKKK